MESLPVFVVMVTFVLWLVCLVFSKPKAFLLVYLYKYFFHVLDCFNDHFYVVVLWGKHKCLHMYLKQ